MQRAVFLDRDGTVNVEKNYLYKIDDWEWIPGAVEAIRGFNWLGFKVMVVTNQAGIARGYYTQDDVKQLHGYVDTLLSKAGARIDGYYYCPHHPEYGEVRSCGCRKPKPGMLLKAQKDFDLDLGRSFLVGDKASDISAARAAGVTPILVMTGYGKEEMGKIPQGIIKAKDLGEAYQVIQGMEGEKSEGTGRIDCESQC